jgi:hypothetical protein
MQGNGLPRRILKWGKMGRGRKGKVRWKKYEDILLNMG